MSTRIIRSAVDKQFSLASGGHNMVIIVWDNVRKLYIGGPNVLYPGTEQFPSSCAQPFVMAARTLYPFIYRSTTSTLRWRPDWALLNPRAI